MAEEQRGVEEVVLVRLLRLNAAVQGIATGLVAGLGLFVATNWLVLKGGPTVGPHLGLLGQFFPGYQVTFVGSLVGLAYGCGCGFLIGYFVSSVYNWIAARREGTGDAGGRTTPPGAPPARPSRRRRGP